MASIFNITQGFNFLPKQVQVFFRAIYRFIFGLRISEGKREFASVNREYWDDKPNKTDQIILIETTNYIPKVNHQAIVVGKYIAEHLGKGGIELIDNSYHERGRKKILKSYNINNISNIKLRYFHTKSIIQSIAKTIEIYYNITSRDDIIDVEYNGERIGDLIYNEYLAKEGKPTIKTKNWKLIKHIFHAFLFANYYDEKTSRTDVQHTIISNNYYYLRVGMLRRMSRKNDVDVHMVDESNDKKTQIKRDEKYSQYEDHFLKPDKNLFKTVFQNSRKLATTLATEYMDKKASQLKPQDLNDVNATNTYDNYPIDIPDHRSAVAIMPHVLTDAVHSDKEMIFPDYYTWLKETLKIVDTIDETDWIIKPHPHRTIENYGYNYEPQTEDLFDEYVSDSSTHVHLINPRVNSLKIANHVTGVVTVRGTVGLEFGCLGIPTIVAGPGPYSGFGFTHEPTTKNEYEELLNNIDSLDLLTGTQVDRAKTLLFVRSTLSTVPSNIIEKETSRLDIVLNPSISKDEIWQKLSQSMDLKHHTENRYNDPLYESVSNYMDYEYRNAVDPKFWDSLSTK